MRVSLTICILSSLAVVVLSWWLSTRSKDFMTAPTEAELEKIRLAASHTNPTAQGLGDALSPTSSQQDQSPIPVILPQHVNHAPRLDDYLEEAKLGPDYLIELAGLLSKDHPERSLTCWERVIDSCKASEEQTRKAAKAIIKLKKSTQPWNTKPEKGHTVVIQAGTGPTTAALLEPALERVGQRLQTISSGVLTIQFKVTAGEEDLVDEGETPVAIWMSGPTESSDSTDVLSFNTPVDSIDGLDEKVIREVYQLIRHRVGRMDDFRPLPKPSGRYSPDKLLEGHITRMVWMKFAESLQNRP